jgi:hypothetical protein
VTVSMKYLIPLLLASVLAVSNARADNFKSARFDPQRNQLIVEMVYRGTNPDHAFHLNWGDCRPLDQEQGMWQVAVDVLDDQWSDAALNDYSRTLKFDLTKLRCRPARVTLRTAPRFYYTLNIPAGTTSPVRNQILRPARPPICLSGSVHRGGSMCVPIAAQADTEDGTQGGHSGTLMNNLEPLTATPGLEIAIFGKCGYHAPAETAAIGHVTEGRKPGCAEP